MEVNNTFTSLIADLPYPNKKAEPQTASKPQETTTKITENNNQTSTSSTQTQSTDNAQSVNILV